MADTDVEWNCKKTNHTAPAIPLTLETLLRHVQDLACFVVKSVNPFLDDKKPRIEFVLDAHANSKRRCSCCGGTGRVHDKLPERHWDYEPLLNIAVYLVYAPRRVICPVSGKPTVEAMPWSLGKSPNAIAHKIFPARWARLLS